MYFARNGQVNGKHPAQCRLERATPRFRPFPRHIDWRTLQIERFNFRPRQKKVRDQTSNIFLLTSHGTSRAQEVRSKIIQLLASEFYC
jgi:hypothetical protein